MGKIEVLNNNLQTIERNIEIYEKEINKLESKISDIETLLNDKETLSKDLLPILDSVIIGGVMDLSDLESGIGNITFVNYDDEIIDYSVNANDLIYKDTIDINGIQVKLYSSKKTDALYVISNGLKKNEVRLLKLALKNTLQENQMAILTYNDDYYHYNINNSRECTKDFAIVGKTNTGKMYSIETVPDKSEINVDDGSNNDTLMTSINGMVLYNRMKMTMEEGTKLNLRVRVKSNICGGQTVTEFERLSFSGGEKDSYGSEHATVRLADDWLPYSHIDDHTNRNLLVVGDGPTRNYGAGRKVIGHVDTSVIPVVVDAFKRGEQSMQATVLYHFEGVRSGWMSKDMLHFYQNVVTDWEKI